MEDSVLKAHVERLKQSDEAAFKAIFDHFQQNVFNFLLYKLRDREQAEDLLQEVFLRIWKNRTTLDTQKSFKSYLYTISSNLSLNAVRDRSSAKMKLAEIPKKQGVSISPEGLLINNELQESIAKAIAGLSEKNRVTFMMSRYEHLSYREISERLDISIKTVETRMGEALKHIRNEVKKFQENRG